MSETSMTEYWLIWSKMEGIRIRTVQGWRRYTKRRLRPSGEWNAPDILESEVEAAIKKLPNNKATGYDELPVELLKTENQTLTKVRANCAIRFYRQASGQQIGWDQYLLQYQRYQAVVPLIVQNIAQLYSSATPARYYHHHHHHHHEARYRGLLRILLQCTQRRADEQFAEEQMGFRKKVGTRDQIFNIRILMEKPENL